MIRHLTLCSLLFFSVSALAAEEAVKPTTPETPAAEAAKVERLKPDQWCWIHDLPKDKCVTCDPKLIPVLKKEGDWCKEHKAAESCCLQCDPVSAKAHIDALRPTEKPKDAP